jgi:cytochrome c
MRFKIPATAAVLALGLGAAPAMAAPPEFAMCATCHSVKAGQNMIGPSLAGVVGKKSGSAAGYAYSPAFKKLNLVWNDANLDKWLAGPMKMAPGTKMTFAGYPDAAKRKAVIAYLKTLK